MADASNNRADLLRAWRDQETKITQILQQRAALARAFVQEGREANHALRALQEEIASSLRPLSGAGFNAWPNVDRNAMVLQQLQNHTGNAAVLHSEFGTWTDLARSTDACVELALHRLGKIMEDVDKDGAPETKETRFQGAVNAGESGKNIDMRHGEL